MSIFAVLLLVVTLLLMAMPPSFAEPLPAQPPAELDRYDVVWSTPSRDAAGSMPIGNGEVVLNAWVEEATHDLRFYIARTDSFTEISRIVKLGGIRVRMTPNPFEGARFSQRLALRDGCIEFRGDGGSLRLFVDSAEHVVHLTGSFHTPTRVEAEVECWRNETRELGKAEGNSAWAVHGAPFPLTETADVFVRTHGASVVWYHRNETSVVPRVWENQSLTGLPGLFDPIIRRTFGGMLVGAGMVRRTLRSLATARAVTTLFVRVATHSAPCATVSDWRRGVDLILGRSPRSAAETRTREWWHQYWLRSWVFVSGDHGAVEVPANSHQIRKGIDAAGGNAFAGTIMRWGVVDRALSEVEVAKHFDDAPTDLPTPRADARFARGLTVLATIVPSALTPGRIADKVTPGGSDGFLFDTHPGNSLRLIVGDTQIVAPDCLAVGRPQNVAATYDAASGTAAIWLDGRRVAQRGGDGGSAITRGYILQRYVQACQSRGAYPVKFNGGYYTVEPAAMGMPHNADFRNWGDCFWLQNVRHMYHPMTVSGDTEMMDAFFRLYEAARPVAESRTRAYHNAEGAYFPETMTAWGTYSGGDYGWDRTGHEPKDVMCPYWANAWNQGPEIVALMLDRWDYTRDAAFLTRRVLPMAESVLRYFDTRFAKDDAGRIVVDPTQVVETYWYGVKNDMPTVAGLISIANRLCSLPPMLLSGAQLAYFKRMRAACPEFPLETEAGERELAPAQVYDPRVSNCENGELYGVWPFRLVTAGRQTLLEEGRRAYAHRKNRLDVGWGYDGNVAALLGLTDEAARILKAKARNSNPAYRWPATWGPNFDWLPDQNHGGNLLNTTQLMLIQADSLEAGGAIRLLPAWPRAWDVQFRLHAPGYTSVECVYRKGEITSLKVSPPSRRKDVVLPAGLAAPNG